MEKSIIENIDKLFRIQIIYSILYLVLIIAAVLVVVGLFKHKLLNSKAKNIALSLLVAICSIGLIIMQIITVIPVYNDYTQRSYIIAENATMTVKEGTTVGMEPTNTVFI